MELSSSPKLRHQHFEEWDDGFTLHNAANVEASFHTTADVQTPASEVPHLQRAGNGAQQQPKEDEAHYDDDQPEDGSAPCDATPPQWPPSIELLICMTHLGNGRTFRELAMEPSSSPKKMRPTTLMISKIAGLHNGALA